MEYGGLTPFSTAQVQVLVINRAVSAVTHNVECGGLTPLSST